MIQKLDLQQTMTPLTAQKCYVNVVYDYDHTVGKNARSSKTKNREHVNFLASWMYLMVLTDNSSFFGIKHCTLNV